MSKTKFKKPDWAKSQLIRFDRNDMVEDLCIAHGCGHPNKEWLAENKHDNSAGVHGCCMCCSLKDIPGFEGYMINPHGSVWSKKSKKFMKSHVKDGYKFIQFRVDGKAKYSSIHRLVAITHLPNPDNLPEINHIDFDRSNNHVKNLEWVTSSQNRQHTYDHNKTEKQVETAKKNGRSKALFSEDDIILIHQMFDMGKTYEDISLFFKCHRETIGRIIRGVTYQT